MLDPVDYATTWKIYYLYLSSIYMACLIISVASIVPLEKFWLVIKVI